MNSGRGLVREYILCVGVWDIVAHFPPSSTRYFLGNDGKEYCWKDMRGTGHVVRLFFPVPSRPTYSPLEQLTARYEKVEVARFTYQVATEGMLAGQKKWYLQVYPSSLDTDIIIITFIIMEKRRREREKHSDKEGFAEDNPFESGFDGGIAAA